MWLLGPQRQIHHRHGEHEKDLLLERLSRFLAPLRFPHELHLIAEECDVKMTTSPHYNALRRAIVICYQFDELIGKFAPAADAKSAEGLTRNEVIDGTLWAWSCTRRVMPCSTCSRFRCSGPRRARSSDGDLPCPANAREQGRGPGHGRRLCPLLAGVRQSRKEFWTQWKAYTDVHGADIQRYRDAIFRLRVRQRDVQGVHRQGRAAAGACCQLQERVRAGAMGIRKTIARSSIRPRPQMRARRPGSNLTASERGSRDAPPSATRHPGFATRAWISMQAHTDIPTVSAAPRRPGSRLKTAVSLPIADCHTAPT